MARTATAAVRAALAKLDAGRGFDLTLHERLALEQAQRETSAPRPLASYAPRTRRRYLNAFDRGETAAEANRRERVAQTENARSRPERIERLRQSIVSAIPGGLRASPDHDREEIALYVEIYGEAAILKALTQQLQNIHRYQAGERNFGGKLSAFNNSMSPLRGEDVSDFASALYYYRFALK